MLQSSSTVSRWRRYLKGSFYCAFCNSKEKHHSNKCPLLDELGLKLVKVSSQGSGGQLSGGATMGTWSKLPTAASPALEPTLVGSPPVPAPNSTSALMGLMVAVIENIEGDNSLTNSFRWYGDKDGMEFKVNAAIFDYLCLQTLPSCCCASITTNAPWSSLSVLTSSTSSLDLFGKTVIKLPSRLVLALLKAVPSEILGAALKLVVADTGATDHMLPDRSTFISYKSVRNLCVRMGNNSYTPVLG